MSVTQPTESEVLDAIHRVSAILGPKFAFGPYDVADIRQEVAVMCLQALPRYRPEAGNLEGFLYTHAKNRLKNLLRDKFRRNDPPCVQCHRADTEGGDSCQPDGALCPKYK